MAWITWVNTVIVGYTDNKEMLYRWRCWTCILFLTLGKNKNKGTFRSSVLNVFWYMPLIFISLKTNALKKSKEASSLLVKLVEADLRSSGTLRGNSVYWHIGQPIFSIFKTFKLGWLVFPKRRYGITTLRCVKSQRSADIVYIAAETWIHAMFV